MKRSKVERWIAVTLAASVAAQGLWIGLWGVSEWRTALQWTAVSLLAGLAVNQAWRLRAKWPAHSDMLLLMAGYGGLGMLLGTWIDAGFPRTPPLTAHCHGGSASLFSWMSGLMLLFAVPPGVVFSRCLEYLRRSFPLLTLAVVLDVTGMLLGMFAAGGWWTPPLARLLGSHFAAMQLAMLAGMLLGMVAAMVLRDVLLGWLDRHSQGPLAALSGFWKSNPVR